jgi:membrane associated rhomboid family serine protease
MQYAASVYVATAFGAVAGGLLGFGVQLITGQDGWVIVLGALGANAGAFLAALRRADGLPVWRVRPLPDAQSEPRR